MYRNTNGTSLISNSTGNCLTNPPSSIGRKLKALGIVKLLNSTDKAQIAFLDKVQEQHATTNIALCNRNYQTQVCLNKLLLCVKTHLFHTRKATALATLKFYALFFCLFQLFGRCNTGLDLHCEVDFFSSSKKGNLTDFFQIHTNRIACQKSDRRIACLFTAARALGF